MGLVLFDAAGLLLAHQKSPFLHLQSLSILYKLDFTMPWRERTAFSSLRVVLSLALRAFSRLKRESRVVTHNALVYFQLFSSYEYKRKFLF